MAGGETWYGHCTKGHRGTSKTQDQIYHRTQRSHIWELPTGTDIGVLRRCPHPHAHCAPPRSSQHCSLWPRWGNKLRVLGGDCQGKWCICNRILLCHEEGAPAIGDDMVDPEGILLSEVSCPQKNKYCLIPLI